MGAICTTEQFDGEIRLIFNGPLSFLSDRPAVLNADSGKTRHVMWCRGGGWHFAVRIARG